MGGNTLANRLLWVLWPAFLVAAVGEMAVFSLLDPQDLHVFGVPVEADRMTVYAAGFFALWAMCAASGALTSLLRRSPFEVNRCELQPQDRPVGCPKREVTPGMADACLADGCEGHASASSR